MSPGQKSGPNRSCQPVLMDKVEIAAGSPFVWWWMSDMDRRPTARQVPRAHVSSTSTFALLVKPSRAPKSTGGSQPACCLRSSSGFRSSEEFNLQTLLALTCLFQSITTPLNAIFSGLGRLAGNGFGEPTRFPGFSIFVSRENPQLRRSVEYARAIGHAWLGIGHRRTLHHAADIRGERRELLYPREGVYRAPFAVVRRTRIPALLLEIGVLANPAEEAWLDKKDARSSLQRALLEALLQVGCKAA